MWRFCDGREFCKLALGLPKYGTNLACYSELARPPLLSKRKIQLITYWMRIATCQDTAPLVREAYLGSPKQNGVCKDILASQIYG